jgi:aminoglycoside 6'-N-acetyltransferase I
MKPKVADRVRAFPIRHAELADAPGWAALRAELWPDEDRAVLATEAARFFEGPLSGGGGMPEAVLVAVEPGPRGTVIGFAELSRRAYAEGCETSPVGFLEGWFVVVERRRQGIGRALVAAAERWARGQGCREFASDALAENMVSARAHTALGFEEVALIRCFRKPLDLLEQRGPTGPTDP